MVYPNGPECECGRFGCLEALVGKEALRRRVGERIGRDVSRDELVKLASSGDSDTTEVLAAAGRELGLAVSNVVTVLASALLLICGGSTELGALFFQPV